MADVFTVLREDHLDVEHMLNRLETQAASGPLDAQDRVERKLLVERLVMELSKHEAVEEQHFWPVVRDTLPDGDVLANTAINQENEGKSVMQRLEATHTPSGEFERLLAAFIPDVREHIEYEQTQVWPKLREALTVEQAEELGVRISKAKLFAPTRPHPHSTATPGMLKTAGVAAAATDRLRDRISGRGKVAHHAHR